MSAIFTRCVSRRYYYRTVLLLFLMFALPALASPTVSVTNNVITRTAWFITNVALYGVGGIMVIWGMIIAAMNKLRGDDAGRRSPWSTMAWGAFILAAPAILSFARDFFNSSSGLAGSLDGMNLSMDFPE